MLREDAGAAVDEPCRVVWAKSWPYDVPPSHWAPLWRHLDDTADVAGLLWDHWLADDIRSLLASGVPGGAAGARRLVRFLAGAHDVGKTTPAFACQVAALSDRMTHAGLRLSPATVTDRSMLRHEIAGAAALDRWLTTRTAAPRQARRQLTAVLAGHHGAYPPLTSVQGAAARPHLFGGGQWETVRGVLLDRAAARAGLVADWPGWAALRVPGPAGVLLTGLVVMADWIASSDHLFPLDDVDTVPEIEPVSTSESGRAQRAWARLQLSPRWRPPAPEAALAAVFSDRFPGVGGAPHPVQASVVDAARTMPAPGLMVVEAPMGSGKTEAALMAAEVLAHRTGAAGVFVALPTQATSDAMFARVRGWLEHLPADDHAQHSLALVHGKAALNDDVAHLPVLRVRGVHDGDRTRPTVVPAADLWMRGRKRAALASFVVGTIDQVLFGALMARHVMLRHLALAGKVVVVDEVHAADTFMATFLDRTLEWLGAEGTPVVLLSATLPSVRRAELYRAYESGRRRRLSRDPDAVDTSVLAGDIGYPVVVTTGDDGPAVTTLDDAATSTHVQVVRLDDDLDAVGDLLDDALRDGGCAGVVRNTVARAQEAARHLEARFGPEVVTVAHARFLAADRRENDLRLLAELGRDGARPDRRIVVGTQVLEQSLDIDLDVLVTDLAPVDLVLQRIGRLHRHRRAHRPDPVATPRCYVTGVDWAAVVPQPVRGSVHVYGRYALLASAAVLGLHLDGAPLLLPLDIARLVQAAYAPDAVPPAGWEDSWAQAATQELRRHDERRRRASTFLVHEPTDGALYGLSSGGVGDLDEDSPQGQACVRESGDSIEVVVVQRGGDGSDRVPDWVPGGGTALPFPHVPLDEADARALARCALRLPPAMSLNPAVFDRVVADLERERFEGWDASPLLKNQLALVIDDDRRASVAGFDLHYDRHHGLTVTSVASPS
ncbi:CRISPR-associated helicase/endonuclease Cas3 [Cellulomonas fimi]|uniref:CRISPR-associated HD domain protein n=2 Tax=Cellulomonas fimi TaxID=1708 RepID=F4H898_CELFA|nr:CRISPR-associated helicase/endonuclease Cas3 [Cellulomonas fimi]AEE44655.1 CRISPR-associated HD domain protein [Cellulomonas fimi ATCC 484]NNH07468.1 CRISPR-associated helicase/endonuclease Cas3 [Cellulomonas fimi]VEH26907.1 helicase Cas3 [Cellulomonas fimi]